jgi:YfiH family protein
MIRFPFLEKHGATALMSDGRDGDCRSREGAEAFVASCGVASSPESLLLINQVHGTNLVDSGSYDGSVEADGILSIGPGALLGIRVADCVPILMYDPVNRAGAVVHAGREGTRQGIAGEAVRAMRERYGTVPGGLIVVIGPSAGDCCYEVGEAVRDLFAENGGVSRETHLDLWETNRNQLVNEGVLGSNVEVSGICTICSGDYHSYRRTKTEGRNLAILGIPKF